MAKTAKYVFLSDSKIRVTPEQKRWIDDRVARHGLTINQAARDCLQHCMECAFFNGNGATSGTIPAAEGK